MLPTRLQARRKLHQLIPSLGPGVLQQITSPLLASLASHGLSDAAATTRPGRERRPGQPGDHTVPRRGHRFVPAAA